MTLANLLDDEDIGNSLVKVTYDTTIYYIAEIADVLEVNPRNEAKVPEFAFCWKLYDRNSKKYSSYTQTIGFSKKLGKRILSILSAITHKEVSWTNIMMPFDFDQLKGKQVSIKFTQLPSGNFSVLFYEYLGKDKRHDFSSYQYEQAYWLPRMLKNQTLEKMSENEKIDLLADAFEDVKPPQPPKSVETKPQTVKIEKPEAGEDNNVETISMFN